MREVLVSLLVTLFLLQAATGVLLMAVYSPSTTNAWSSVWYIQAQAPAGWLLRGLHYFAADAMIALGAMLVAWLALVPGCTGANRRRWWWALTALAAVLAAALSGYLLPWDQRAYWGTVVRTNILARTPAFGEALRRLLLGGEAIGNLALTRFYTLHVMVLPLMLGLLMFRKTRIGRSGVVDAENAQDHRHTGHRLTATLVGAVALLGLLGVTYYSHGVDDHWLTAPADPAQTDYPARPEWWALGLYQWLKYFHGPVAEAFAAIVVPTLIVMLLVLCPYAPRVLGARWGSRAAGILIVALTLGAGVLSLSAVAADRRPPAELEGAARERQHGGQSLTAEDERVLRAGLFHHRRERAQREARRAFALAQDGVPPQGPLAMLVGDPQTRGPTLFAAHCASCHRFDGHDGTGWVTGEKPTSSDLAGFATRAWVRGLLENPASDRYFGLMLNPEGEPAHTRMAKWTADQREGCSTEECRRTLSEDFDAVAAYLEDESWHPGRLTGGESAKAVAPAVEAHAPDGPRVETDEDAITRGRQVFATVCNECHGYQGLRRGTTKAPDMYGYGSIDWLELMIADPAHELRYRAAGREPARMPAFQDRLSEQDRRLIARWLHGSRVPGAPEAALRTPSTE
ncbi:MAG: cytochrome b N-terminal domain-containing protein [Planctomycetes bacterium]|nr:cytochrome b N-terminal domain-containing protein [Planctomycetota bacterium]